MAHNTVEIEIQVQVEHSRPLKAFLTAHAMFKEETRQVDEYFSPVHRDFLATRPVAEWLRLRNADGAYSMTYKKWHHEPDGRSHYCDEYETTLGSIERARDILSALDCQSLVVVDKVRTTWVYQDYEVAIDAVKALGNFVEIEYIGNDMSADPKKITGDMITFLKNVGCGSITRNYNGYPFLMLFPNDAHLEIM